ncbi:MAG: hypothetical protein ACRCV9_12255 [Burkholderiaceae bacterium]
MTQTVLHAAASAVEQVLAASPSLAQYVGRVPVHVLDESIDSAVMVKPRNASLSQQAMSMSGPRAWDCDIEVAFAVRVTAVPPDAALDALVFKAAGLLLADYTLGGQVASVTVRGFGDLESEGLGQRFASAVMSLTVKTNSQPNSIGP